MSELWALLMLISGGLFAGGVLSIAWERVPAWRVSDLSDFRTGFAHTLRRVDRLQPALLVVCLVSTIGFAIGAGGAARTFAVFAAAGFLLILVGSAARLVPMQRRLVASGTEPSASLERLRAQWLCGSPGSDGARAGVLRPPRRRRHGVRRQMHTGRTTRAGGTLSVERPSSLDDRHAGDLANSVPPWLDVVDALTDQLAQLTPDPAKAQYYPIKVTTSITINAPASAPRGARVTLDIGNGRSSGSITVSFDTAYMGTLA